MILMKKLIQNASFVVLCTLLLSTITHAQVKFSAKDNISLVVSGTSTLHAWDMKSSKGDCQATFTLNSTGAPSAISSLSFSTTAQSLKSEHKAMDKNAYKALKAEQHPQISFSASSGTVTGSDAAGYTVKCTGKLTIAGTTKDAEVIGVCKVNTDKSITVTGSTQISMKNFGMSPPSFMMGAVKTGNDVVLKFNLTLRQ